MADDLDLLDNLLDETQPLHNKERDTLKFKPKNLKNPPKLSVPKLQNPSTHHSQHADSFSEAGLDYSLSPHSTNDKFKGTSNPQSKLQPQRKKQPAAPGSDGPSDINRTEIPDHKIEGTLIPDIDLSKSDFEAPTSLSDIDLLDDISLDPLLSNAQPTIKLQAKENESEGKGRKLNSSVPEAYGTESLDTLINIGPVTSEEIQVNDASESGVEHTQNDEQGLSGDTMTQKEKEDAPNLDEIFNFLEMDEASENPILEIEEANDEPADENYTGEDKNQGREEKEIQTDVKRPSKGRKRNTTDADANIDEESPKKKGRLPHRIRHKRRKVDPALLEMPEDAINPRQISIRNLILLAEAKEKKWNREASSRSSNGDTSSRPRRRGQEEYLFEACEEENSEQVSAPDETFEPTVKKLNYHTYMNRSSSSRWTSSETELFYKGIRQFGTDFAMIQQLFPNRTRHQIKLKFKSEDKKHPTRVHDAITHRLTDNSQFEKVIEILEIEADKVAHEDLEPSSQAAHWKNEEEISEAEGNFETSHNNMDNSGKNEPVPNDDLDAVFNWDNNDVDNSDKHEPVPKDGLDAVFDWDNQEIEGEESLF